MRSPKITIAKLEAMIQQGRGTGTGNGYTPWILPTKRGTSSSSNQSYVPMPMSRRHSFYLSLGERHLAHVYWWLGAADVREQFPLWPWPHPHPMAEIAPQQTWPDHPGMDAVARDADIRVYGYPGLHISYVLTIDLMVTLRGSDDALRLLGISCKPQEQFDQARPSSRLRERLELDRRYCITANIPHLLVHPEQLPRVLVRQLEWLAPLAQRHQIDWLINSDAYQRFVQRLNQHVWSTPAHAAAEIAGERLGWNRHQIDFATHLAMWRQDVDVDLSTPISMASPLPGGGRRLRDELRSRLLGLALC